MPASASSLSALLPASAVGREPLSAVESVGLVQALRVIPDPRRRRGRRPRPAVGAAARAAGGDGRRVFLDRDRAVGQDGPAGAGHLQGVPVGGDVPTGAGRGRHRRGGSRVDHLGDRPPGPRPGAAAGVPGVVDVSTSWLEYLPAELLPLLDAGRKDEFDRYMAQAGGDPETARTFAYRARPYGARSPFDLFTEVRRYQLRDVADRIRARY